MNDKSQVPYDNPRWLTLTAVVALLAVVAVGAWFYKDQERTLRNQANTELATIARLKADQITAWRSERLGDAQRITQSQSVASTVAAWRRDPSAANTAAVRKVLQPMKSDGGFRDVLIVSGEGRTLLRLSDTTKPLSTDVLTALAKAIASGEALMTDPHAEENGANVHMDVVAPIYEGASPSGKTLGAIVMQAYANDYLYPMVEGWPTPSTTAETLLVVRDHNTVRLLNGVRHPLADGSERTLPITQTDAPAVMAVLGRTGLVEGKDYRGAPVLAYLAKIPDSSWYMIAKIDKSEALSTWRARSLLIVLLVLAVALLVGVGALLLLQRGRSAQLAAMVASERAKLHAEDELLKLNASLEHIVDERTEELGLANEELQMTSEELAATNEELRSANEDLTEANDAKTRFLRSMSHELRTPLNSVIGFSGTMLQGLAGTVSDEQRRQLEMISHAGHHLLDLINDILDLSRIEAGKMEMTHERFMIGAIAREVLECVESPAAAKGLELELLGADCGVELVSDPVRVRQILLNLVGNAVKFTDSGRVTLRIDDTNPDLLRISVTDTGPGIPTEDHERIFGEFTQRDLHSAPNKEGTGLGLAISRGLATLIGATIELDSREGQGSTFTLLLPV